MWRKTIQCIRVERIAFSLCLLITPAVFAQAPSPSMGPMMPTVFLNDRDWGFWVTTEAMYLSHSNSEHTVPLFQGPETVNLGDTNFGWQPTGRLTVGFFEGDYEVSGSYLFLTSWDTSQSGFLTHGLDFDGPVAYLAADATARTTVDAAGTPNFLTPQTIFSALNAASNASGETDALEFLHAGARFESQYITKFSDLEINFNQREQLGRNWRFGLGFRHSIVQESGYAAVSGTFGTVISNGPGIPFNNGLSDGSLTGTGLTLISDVSTNNGFSDADPAVPTAADQLLMISNVWTSNQLYGLQVNSEAFLYQTENLSLSFFAKPGVYINAAKGTIRQIYADTLNDKSTYSRTLSDKKNTFSFVGQVGTTCRFFLLENVCLSAGYDLYFLTGLALASDQMSQITTAVPGAANFHLQTDNTVLIHGGRVGLEIAF